jgi:hypothetical protein
MKTKTIRRGLGVTIFAGMAAMLAVVSSQPPEGTAFAAKSKAAGSSSAVAPTAAPAGTPAAPAPVEGKKQWRVASGQGCADMYDPQSYLGAGSSKPRDCTASDTCCILEDKDGRIDTCTNLKVDPENCGGCGRACQYGEACIDGLCGCGAGKGRCNGRCVDVQSDGSNCGACGHACKQFCEKGACSTCKKGTTWCGQLPCSDLMNDESDCGKCGHNCPEGWACTRGRCLP